MSIKKIFLIILGIILFIIGFESPQGMIFPMWILVYLFKDRLTKIVDKIWLPIAFIGLGTFFGLLTEFFAVIENIDIDYGQRVLMSQNPVTDMLLAPAYYTLFIIFIYFLLKSMHFLKKVFL
jgi:hypothetical protein